MPNADTSRLTRLFLHFAFSVSLFLIAALLGTWGTPTWFSLFPLSSGFRFLIAIGVWSLSLALYLAARMLSVFQSSAFNRVTAFSLSFLPVPVFAILVLSGKSIQTLGSLASFQDLATWGVVTALAVRTGTGGQIHRKYRQSLKLTRCLAAFFFVTAAVCFIPGVPAIVVIVARFVALALFSYAALVPSASADTPSIDEAVRVYRLTPREKEILALLVTGKTNGEIARALFISLSTVKTHVASIFDKMSAGNRFEVLARCGDATAQPRSMV